VNVMSDRRCFAETLVSLTVVSLKLVIELASANAMLNFPADPIDPSYSNYNLSLDRFGRRASGFETRVDDWRQYIVDGRDPR
jgi:hypothetical protein